MKKIKINTSVPAYLSDFTAEKDCFSRAKLKVFYVGETADKRLFTQSFAEKIIKTLPYSPVVSYYDKDKDDFVGHAEQQNIYGIVDPLTPVEFEEIDGQTWAIAEVVLYTERPDETGEIAKKIVGKPHSLELNPKTLQYNINYDKHRKLKNIEFTDGSFVGVSVLGSDQQPAFTGSAFFTVDKEFESRMDLLKDYVKNSAEENRMEENILNFVELSWGERAKYLHKALSSVYSENYWLIDVYDEYCIYNIFDEALGEVVLLKCDYSIEGDSCTLGDAKPVRVVYEEIISNSEVAEASCEEEKEEDKKENCEEKEDEVVEEEKEDENSKEDEVVEEKKEDEKFEEEEEKEEIEDKEEEEEKFEEEPKEEEEKEEEEKPLEEGNHESIDTSALAESERQELEALKKQEKLNLIDSFSSDLGEEILSKYMAEVDSFTKDELELELLKQFRANGKTAKKTVMPFKLINDNINVTRPSIEDLVNKYKS